jgi:GntR family transcriptional regulator
MIRLIQEDEMFSKNILDVNSEIPLYLQLQNHIEEMIKNKQLVTGDILPSEAELQQVLGISRSTIRIAFQNLEDKGLILRRRGRGTFVAEKLKRNLDNLYSFTADMVQLGRVPTSRVILFERISCGVYAGQFNLPERESLFEIHRIRLADNIPVLLEKTLVPVKFCPELTPRMLEKELLYHILNDQNQVAIESAVESYEPVNMTKREMELLEIRANPCAFSIRRVAYTAGREAVEITNAVMPGERSKFEVCLLKNGLKISRDYKEIEV